MSGFVYKEVDAEGLQTLDLISNAGKFNKWMFDVISPYCKGEVMEIGSGIGNISEHFLKEGFPIYLSDIRENYCELLRQKFHSHPKTRNIQKVDLAHPAFEREYSNLLNSFDTVFALNVVEHIKDDHLAIQNCYKLLKKDGVVIILVPAYQNLYNRLDKELEHYRRYNKSTLSKIITANQFQLVHSRYFNMAGIMGWYFSGTIQKNKTIKEGQLRLYNSLVPLFKFLDKITFNKVGLSVICVGRK
jgi:2-polyprenyl-3-methyl-5-hydroxy-6-metoxy-1,4-benzoquinol methylase